MGARTGPNHGPIRAFSAIFACTGPKDGPVRSLLEDELGELVQAVFPDDEVVLALRVFDERAGDAVLVAEGLEAGAVVHQVVLAAADHPEDLVFRFGLFHVGNQCLRHFGVGGGGEAADARKQVHVRQTEVQGLATAHGKTRDGAVHFVGLDVELPFDEGDEIVHEVEFEVGEGLEAGVDVPLGAVVLLSTSIRHHDDHRNGLSVGDEVVQDDVWHTLEPFTLVAANAVKEVKDGILLLRIELRGEIDRGLADGADGGGLILHEIERPVRDVRTLLVKAGGRLNVRVELDVNLGRLEETTHAARLRRGTENAAPERGQCQKNSFHLVYRFTIVACKCTNNTI